MDEPRPRCFTDPATIVLPMNPEELQSLYYFSDCTVLVTGGAGVLGSEIAGALVGCDANVVIPDRGGVPVQKPQSNSQRSPVKALHNGIENG